MLYSFLYIGLFLDHPNSKRFQKNHLFLLFLNKAGRGRGGGRGLLPGRKCLLAGIRRAGATRGAPALTAAFTAHSQPGPHGPTHLTVLGAGGPRASELEETRSLVATLCAGGDPSGPRAPAWGHSQQMNTPILRHLSSRHTPAWSLAGIRGFSALAAGPRALPESWRSNAGKGKLPSSEAGASWQ